MSEVERSESLVPGQAAFEESPPPRSTEPVPIERSASDLLTTLVVELGRADSKAGILLGWVGAAVALLTTVASGRHLSVAPAVAVWGADALLAAAAALLLSVVRPHLKPGTSWIRYASLNSDAILADLRRTSTAEHSEAWAAARVAELSRIAVAKYRRIRWSVDLLFCSGGLLLLALILAV